MSVQIRDILDVEQVAAEITQQQPSSGHLPRPLVEAGLKLHRPLARMCLPAANFKLGFDAIDAIELQHERRTLASTENPELRSQPPISAAASGESNPCRC